MVNLIFLNLNNYISQIFSLIKNHDLKKAFIRCLGKIISYHKHLKNSKTIAKLTLTALQIHTEQIIPRLKVLPYGNVLLQYQYTTSVWGLAKE